jgi:hypothetical protein
MEKQRAATPCLPIAIANPEPMHIGSGTTSLTN